MTHKLDLQLYAEVTKSQAPHPETPKIQKNPRTGKIIKILLLMSGSLSAHIINAGIPPQYESIAVCYIAFVHV